MIYLIDFISLKRSIPNSSADPLVYGYNPVNIEMVEVLPAPLCPSNTKI
jgi:hypothetical protein